MTLKALKEKIKRLSNNKQEELNSLEVTINYPYLNIEQTLKGFVDIYRFVQRQNKGWEKLKKTPDYLEVSKKYFTEINENLESYINNGFKETEISWKSTTYLKDAKLILNKSVYGEEPNKVNIFTYDAHETVFLLSLYGKRPNSSYAAATFLSDGIMRMPVNRGRSYDTKEVYLDFDDFIGMQQAYEFRLQDNERVRRSELEKKSLEELRENFNTYLEKAEETLQELIQKNNDSLKISTNEIENIKAKKVREFTNLQEHADKKYQEWFKSTRSTYSNWFQETNSNHKTWSSDTDKNYKDWLSKTQKSFNEFDKKSKHTIKEKEELYIEKLKLEAPATYWRDRAKELGKEGRNWLICLIITSGVAVVLLGCVLLFLSNGILKEIFTETGSAVRWSIIFVTFISFLAYGVRTFAKLMFSSYHLSRDAEEREQLAYVYLALKKEQSIDDTERHLIMQSIFSRADSGLLKADAAPTMPGNIVDKFIK